MQPMSCLMKQAASLLANEDPDETSSSKRPTTFLNVVALGNVGAGKYVVLNNLIEHPVLPTGENGATRAPIILELSREASLSSKAIILQIDNKSQQVSASGIKVKVGRDESSPYAAMLDAQDVAQRCKVKESALRALARSGMKIGRIGNKSKLFIKNVFHCIIGM